MAKIKYYYDTKTLSYKRIKLSPFKKFQRILFFLITSLFSGLLMIFVFFTFFDSPKEKMLNREIENMVFQYNQIKDKLNQISLVMADLQNRDDNIYRVIFEAEPIPNSIPPTELL